MSNPKLHILGKCQRQDRNPVSVSQSLFLSPQAAQGLALRGQDKH